MNDNCCICLEKNDIISIECIQCKQQFHKICIKNWINRRNDNRFHCPLCQFVGINKEKISFNILNSEEQEFIDSEEIQEEIPELVLPEENENEYLLYNNNNNRKNRLILGSCCLILLCMSIITIYCTESVFNKN